MKWYIVTLLLILTITSCGQDIKRKRLDSEGATTNDFQNLSCFENSGSVCGQPPMPVCALGMLCAQVMPNPKTYANDCEMKKAKAELIRNGNCPSGTL